MCLRTHKPHYTIASVALYRAWVGSSSTYVYVVRFPPSRGVTVRRGPFKKCLCRARCPSLYWYWTYSHTITLAACLYFLLSGSLPVYSCTIRLTAVYSHCQARCLSSLTLSGSYSLTIRLTASLLSLAGLLSILSLSLRLAACIFSCDHSDSLPVYSLTIRLAACLFSCAHSGSLPIYSHSVRLAAYLFSLSLRLAAYLHILTLSGSLSVYSHSVRLTAYLFSLHQARCLSILTLTQARCLSILTLTQARCLSILTLSGSLPMYSQAHYLCILRLTAYVFSGSLPI